MLFNTSRHTLAQQIAHRGSISKTIPPRSGVHNAIGQTWRNRTLHPVNSITSAQLTQPTMRQTPHRSLVTWQGITHWIEAFQPAPKKIDRKLAAKQLGITLFDVARPDQVAPIVTLLQASGGDYGPMMLAVKEATALTAHPQYRLLFATLNTSEQTIVGALLYDEQTQYITNVAVHPDFRQQQRGYGRHIIASILHEKMYAEGQSEKIVDSVMLAVDRHNTVMLDLCRRWGAEPESLDAVLAREFAFGDYDESDSRYEILCFNRDSARVKSFVENTLTTRVS